MSERLDQLKRAAENYYAAKRKSPTLWDVMETGMADLSPPEQDYFVHYCECLSEGCSPMLSDMLASRIPPMSNTDREFLEGTQNQFVGQEKVGNALKAIAERHGQSVTGKRYVGGLARFPGDPEAWVSDRHDVQKTLEKRGWGSQGSVNVKARNEATPIKLDPKKLSHVDAVLKGGSLKDRLRRKGLSSEILGDK